MQSGHPSFLEPSFFFSVCLGLALSFPFLFCFFFCQFSKTFTSPTERHVLLTCVSRYLWICLFVLKARKKSVSASHVSQEFCLSVCLGTQLHKHGLPPVHQLELTPSGSMDGAERELAGTGVRQNLVYWCLIPSEKTAGNRITTATHAGRT